MCIRTGACGSRAAAEILPAESLCLDVTPAGVEIRKKGWRRERHFGRLKKPEAKIF